MGDHVRRLVPLATTLGGGVAGSEQEMCGALSGGLLLIGALHGRDEPGADDSIAYGFASEFRRRFLSAFGATQCNRLRNTVVNGTGGLGSCRALVEQAVEILIEVLDDDQGGPTSGENPG